VSRDLILMACCAMACCTAAGQGPAVRDERLLVVSGSPQGSGVSPGEVMRTIQDPNTGMRWLLVRSERHPGRPGRLLLANARSNPPRPADGGGARESIFIQPDQSAELPVIRAGDLVRVEEHTAIADVRLEAVALEAARVGAPLTVRLKIGGRVEHGVALAPGRASLTPFDAAPVEARP
jgi:hypothetical protein